MVAKTRDVTAVVSRLGAGGGGGDDVCVAMVTSVDIEGRLSTLVVDFASGETESMKICY